VWQFSHGSQGTPTQHALLGFVVLEALYFSLELANHNNSKYFNYDILFEKEI
jgi:hypothetical protein